MTVIAGVSMLDGVMLMADTRVTVLRGRQAPLHCDIAQKIYPLTGNVTITFAGDVATAAALLRGLMLQLHHRAKRRRIDPASLLQWVPRYLKAAHARLVATGRPVGHVDFIIGAVYPGRPNQISKERLFGLVRRAVSDEAVMQRKWMPDAVMQVLLQKTPGDAVAVPHGVQSVLARMKPPNFELRTVPPLTCVTIGSGAAPAELERAADWFITSGNDMMAMTGLESQIHDFAVQNGITSVGGMYPTVKLDARGTSFLRMGRKFEDADVAIGYDASIRRWIQENRTVGRKQKLLHPWEINASALHRGLKFDDYKDALERFSPLRAKR